MIKFCVLALTAIAVAGCTLEKKADNMQSSMDEMKSDTKQIMGDSKHLGESTDNLQHEMTFDRSANSMDQYSRQMWGEDKSVGGKDVSDPQIMLYAGMVMKAMWSQFWTGDKTETVGSLDERMETSTEILMVSVMAHTPAAHQVDVTNPDLDYKGVAALAAKLEFTRYEFERALDRKGLAQFNFYDVMITALRNRSALTRTEQLPLTTAKILQFQQDAIYMLQLRHNFLPMMVLGSLTDFKDRGDLSRLGMATLGSTASLDTFGVEQLKEWTNWLKAARQTRKDLLSMGIEPEYNTMFRRLLLNLDFGQQRLMALPAASLTGKTKLQREFTEAYLDLLKI